MRTKSSTGMAGTEPDARNPNPFGSKHPFFPITPDLPPVGPPHWPPIWIHWNSTGGVDLSQAEGAIVRQAGDPALKQYLIMGGAKRWIQDGQTFINLFTIHALRTIMVTTTEEWDSAPAGNDITTGSFLAVAAGGPVYFVDGIHKRGIPNPQTLTEYQFIGEIRVMSQEQIDLFPDGPVV